MTATTLRMLFVNDKGKVFVCDRNYIQFAIVDRNPDFAVFFRYDYNQTKPCGLLYRRNKTDSQHLVDFFRHLDCVVEDNSV